MSVEHGFCSTVFSDISDETCESQFSYMDVENESFTACSQNIAGNDVSAASFSDYMGLPPPIDNTAECSESFPTDLTTAKDIESPYFLKQDDLLHEKYSFNVEESRFTSLNNEPSTFRSTCLDIQISLNIFSQVGTFISVCTVYIFLVFFMEKHGTPDSMITMAFSGMFLADPFGRIFYGLFCDFNFFDKRLSNFFMLVVACLIQICMPFVVTDWQRVLMATSYGATISAFFGGSHFVLMDVTTSKNRGRAISIDFFCQGAANAVIPLVLGQLTTIYNDWDIIFISSGCIVLAVSLSVIATYFIASCGKKES